MERRRVFAFIAFATLVASAVVAVVLIDAVTAVAVALGAVLMTGVSGWYLVTTTGIGRAIGGVVVAGGFVVLLSVSSSASSQLAFVALLFVSLAVSIGGARYALGRDRKSLRAAPPPGVPVGPAARPALIVNPRSGDGVADAVGLIDAAKARGIEVVMLDEGLDLAELAARAIAAGADAIGMAGGDGSQAVVASLAMKHRIAHVCIPAGTRNHFALDLGLDRDDVIGALDAFGDAHERRVDLAQIGDRVFVNNVSLGAYATVVQSSEYREAKVRTAASMLPELFGHDGPTCPMTFGGPDGELHHDAALLLVANNAYTLTRLSGLGTREKLDGGELGVAAVEIDSALEVAGFVAAEAAGLLGNYPGFHEWTTAEFRVDADGPIEAGVDGEALTLDPPLEFRSLPGALRVRIPSHAPGWSPAALSPPSVWWTVRTLAHVLAGHRTTVADHESAPSMPARGS